jgi:hypothetical protein
LSAVLYGWLELGCEEHFPIDVIVSLNREGHAKCHTYLKVRISIPSFLLLPPTFSPTPSAVPFTR